jgi:MerR family copper efflux transcriptional regulator
MSTPDGHRISEVAARTGFSASALRFYENVGLVEPARTAAGYRVYDDRSAERLRFIARGKDLGLSLDEIAGMLPAWDEESCAQVAGRLGTRLADELLATRTRIAELTAFAANLEWAAHRLAADVDDGPCGDDCACAPDRSRTTRVTLTARPTAAGPITCTLGPDDVGIRVEEWRRLVDPASGREAIEGGVRLQFPPGTDLGPIASLVAAEQRCCSFFTFRITVTVEGVTLDVIAPPDGRAMVDQLVGETA